MFRRFVLVLLLAVPGYLISAAAVPTEAVAASPWYMGTWKHSPTPGMSLVVTFRANGVGSLNIYKGTTNMGGGATKYKKAGSTLIVTRNGVDVKFPLDEGRKVVKTADGSRMTKVR